MREDKLWVRGLVHAAGTFIYVAVVAWLMSNGQAFFGQPSGFIVPLFILLLFVVSAAVTGLLVLGKPVQMYLNGAKKEAVSLLAMTLAWLVLFLILIVIALLI